VAAPGVLLALAAGCNKTKTEEAPAASASAAAADSTPAASASADVAPPPAVVSGDPDIPLNEAVVGTPPLPPDYAADIAPPAPVTEEQPPSPEPGNVWVPGYWWWSVPFHRYVWVSGAWRNPPPEQVWTPGEWVSSGDKYVWVPGFWATRGTPRPPQIGVAPPLPPVETFGAPPSPGFVWTPGYYAWREERYVWVGGSWLRPPGEGYGWIEPRYVGYPGHYYFQPGRWDYPPARRGVVYRPDPNVRAGMHFSPVPVPASVVSEHVSYVAAASHAFAHGATRMPNGGYTYQASHSGIVTHLPGTPAPGGGEPPGGHAAPPPGNRPPDQRGPSTTFEHSTGPVGVPSHRPGGH